MENDAWAQTLFTITPEEDGYIREITPDTIISGSESTPLDLDVEHIASRQSLVNSTRDFIDPRELEKSEFRDSECQTYMKGFPKVKYEISYRDEASQTLYIGKNYPPTPGPSPKAVAKALNQKSLPKLKKGQLVQTIITVMDDIPLNMVLSGLLYDVTEEEQNDPDLVVNATEDEIMKIDSWDLLNFVLERVMWIADTEPEIIAKTKDTEIETIIQYNHALRRFMVDSEVQTNMSLTPSKSNSKLLDDYLEVKKFIGDLLEDQFEMSVGHRMIVDGIIGEIIDRCSELIHLALQDEAIQTTALGQPFNARDSDILRKLGESGISVQSPATIAPIIDAILNQVVSAVSADSADVVKFVVNRVVQRTTAIGKKLDDIKQSSVAPPIDHVFARRKQKLAASMQKKEVEDASTQTNLGGVPDLRKYPQHKEVVCCACPTTTECRWCLSEGDRPPQKDTKILRTQDILLAYRPCYVVVDPAEATVDMVRPCPPESQELSVQTKKYTISESSSDSSSLYEQCPCVSSVPAKPELSGSASEWSRAVDTVLADAWSFSKSPSKESKSTTSTQVPQSTCKSSRSQIPLPKTTMDALQILKTTFCNRQTCPGLFNVIEDPKYMTNELSPRVSAQDPDVYFCIDDTPAGSDECICASLNEKIRDKLKTISNKMPTKSNR